MAQQASSITLEASLGNLEMINSFLHKWAKKAGLSIHRENELFLAVEEVYVNIIKHAYIESAGKVAIRCHMDGNSLVITIKDAGIPFDPLELPEPHFVSCVEGREMGGLGVFLMRRSVDNVRYERQGKYNVLTLVKSKKEDAQCAGEE